jgi:hypothetical protein
MGKKCAYTNDNDQKPRRTGQIKRLLRVSSYPNLVYTKYCDLECYFFSENLIQDLICGAGAAKISNWALLFQQIIRSVTILSSFRIALAEGGFSFQMVDINKCLRVNEDGFEIVLDFLVDKTCHKNLRSSDIVLLKNETRKWIRNVDGSDFRLVCRGHDFIDIISWVIKNFGGKKHIADSLGAILFLMIPQVCSDMIEPISL